MLKHSNIVRFYGFSYEEKYDDMEGDSYILFYIVMEKMQFSLDEYIKKLKQAKNAPAKEEVSQLFFDVLDAMIYLQ